jgi:hypothetical protein
MAGYGTFGDTRRRRRYQALWRTTRFLFGLIAVLGVGIYGIRWASRRAMRARRSSRLS